MIGKYKSEIIRFYKQKKDNGELSTNLMCLTPAKIRDEFYLLLSAGCDNTDLRTLRDFFEIPYGKELSKIPSWKWDIDKFKPLCNFLKNGINTREKNVELLAWLIDFCPRPFSNYWRASKGKTEPLSDLAITENGIIQENKSELHYDRRHNIPTPEGTSKNIEAGILTLNHWNEKGTEVAKYPNSLPKEENRPKEVVLQYPSGIKLSVDASDLSLIAQLLKL